MRRNKCVVAKDHFSPFISMGQNQMSTLQFTAESRGEITGKTHSADALGCIKSWIRILTSSQNKHRDKISIILAQKFKGPFFAANCYRLLSTAAHWGKNTIFCTAFKNLKIDAHGSPVYCKDAWRCGQEVI